MTASLLITGATGFIGCRLAQIAQERGLEVHAWGAVNNDVEAERGRLLEATGVDLQHVDLTDAERVESQFPNVDWVIHLAAAQHEAAESEAYFNRINVDGTAHLMASAARAGVDRFVYGSTIGVYGGQSGDVLDESSPVRPANKYGRSKAAAERVVREFEGDLRWCIARIAETYGPGDRRLLKLFRGIQKRRFFIMGGGDNLHQLAYVDDLCEDLIRCAELEASVGETIILAGDGAITTSEMCEDVAEAVGKPLISLKAPLWPFDIAAFLIEKVAGFVGKQPPISRRSLDFFSKSYCFSTDKRRRILAREHSVSFEEGAARTAEWYRKHRFLGPTSMKLPPDVDLSPPTAPVDSSTLQARLEPFDSYWQGPEDLASGFEKFGAYYRTNYLPRMPAERGSKTLVVSCGPGYLVKVLVDAGYNDVVGIDSDPDKVAVSARHELPCKQARAFEYLQENDTQYDVIVLEQELNHLTMGESVDFLRLCRSRLRPGGRIIVYAMNGANPMVGSENLAHNIDHFYTVAEFSLKQIMALGGFERTEVFALKIYVFWSNPLNYVGLAITGLLEFATRIVFKLYGKDVGVLSKKIAAISYV